MKGIVDSVFGKGESIKIVLKNYLENKNVLKKIKEVKDFKISFLREKILFKLIIEMMVEM